MSFPDDKITEILVEESRGGLTYMQGFVRLNGHSYKYVITRIAEGTFEDNYCKLKEEDIKSQNNDSAMDG